MPVDGEDEVSVARHQIPPQILAVRHILAAGFGHLIGIWIGRLQGAELPPVVARVVVVDKGMRQQHDLVPPVSPRHLIRPAHDIGPGAELKAEDEELPPLRLEQLIRVLQPVRLAVVAASPLFPPPQIGDRKIFVEACRAIAPLSAGAVVVVAGHHAAGNIGGSEHPHRRLSVFPLLSGVVVGDITEMKDAGDPPLLPVGGDPMRLGGECFGKLLGVKLRVGQHREGEGTRERKGRLPGNQHAIGIGIGLRLRGRRGRSLLRHGGREEGVGQRGAAGFQQPAARKLHGKSLSGQVSNCQSDSMATVSDSNPSGRS